MKLIFVSSVFLFIFSVATFAQTSKNSPCPMVSITGPAEITKVGETATFTASVSKGSSFTYNWAISDGTIVEGLGTSIIKVMTTSAEAEKEITATVEVKGIPSNCVNTASQKAFVSNGIFDPIVADEYGKLSNRDEEARLQNIAVQLKQNKDFKAYFVVYLPKKNLNETAKRRISKIKNYLLKNQKISADKMVFLTKQADSVQTRIYLVPSDAAIFFPQF